MLTEDQKLSTRPIGYRMDTKTLIIAIFAASLFGAACTAAVMHLADDGGTADSTELKKIERRIDDLEKKLAIARGAYSTEYDSDEQEQESLVVVTEVADEEVEESVEAELLEEDLVELQEPSQADIAEQRRTQRAQRIARMQPDFRREQLVARGFTQDEAARIVQLESDAALQQLYDQYRFLKQQREENPEAFRLRARTDSLRDQLGEDDYERYLIANGRPTSVTIGTVMNGSPGANAGLQAGDEIVSYNDQRVFNMTELNNLTYDGTEGENVLVEVRREGESVQLTIPRGPIGVRSARF